jgi:two-component system KDP operon response regulator KdpE
MQISTNQPTVLIVDDERPVRRMLRMELDDCSVVEAETGREAMFNVRILQPRLVLLDLGLPDIDGLRLIPLIRSLGQQTAVIVLSGRTDEHTKVTALDAGADDFVAKPFGSEELRARIRVVLRRRWAERRTDPVFTSGDLSVDLAHRLVRRGEEELRLSPKEYDILEQLVIHAGKVVKHKSLLDEVWGRAPADSTHLRWYVQQIRQKVECEPSRPKHVLTVHGVGYRLV